MNEWLTIGLAVAAAVIPQLGLFLWWSSSVHTKIGHLESDNKKLYLEVNSIVGLQIRIAVLENTIHNQTQVLEQIRDDLRFKSERSHQGREE